MNLNSLYGRWTIDLQHPDYETNGIFALTGPTGGGKTTILDALTLALYGQTVRLGKITKSSNEIMSRGTGECMAEVVFSCSKGVYRCTWYQHRARKNPEGNLAEAAHEISDYVSGDIIENKKSKVKEVIVDKTGMDFTQFTRSMLLAQGSFDTFLKADSEEKSRILEQITGTEIYSAIGKSVYERRKGEEEKLQQLKGDISRFSLLSDEQVQQLRSETAATSSAIQGKEKERDTLSAHLRWKEHIRSLTEELALHRKKSKQIEEETEAFSPSLKQLTRSRTAAGIQHMHTSLLSSQSKLALSQEKREKRAEQITALESSNTILTEALEKLNRDTLETSQLLEQERETVKKVYALDQSIREKNQSLTKEREQLLTMQSSLRNTCTSLIHAQEQQKSHLENLNKVKEYLKSNSGDENLASDRETLRHRHSAIRNLESDLHELSEAITHIEQEIEKLEKAVSSIQTSIEELQQNIEDKEKNITEKESELSRLLDGRLLREVVREKEHLLTTRAFQQRIADLEAYRQELSDGIPCPLCGSPDHPYAAGNVPEVSETDRQLDSLSALITAGEAVQKEMEKGKQIITDLQKQLSEDKQKLALTNADLTTKQESLKEKQTQKKKTLTAKEKEQTALFDLAAPYGVLYQSERQLMDALEERYSLWKQKSEQLNTLTSSSLRLEGDISHLADAREEKKTANRTKACSIHEQENEHTFLVTERTSLYGTKNPEIEIKTLTDSQKTLALKVKEANESLQQNREACTTYLGEKGVLDQEIQDLSREIEIAEESFTVILQEKGFSNAEDFLASLLPSEHMEKLEKKNEELRSAKEGITAVIGETAVKLKTEEEKQLCESRTEELEQQIVTVNEKIEELREQLIPILAKLQSDEDARKRIAGKEKEVENQELITSRWNILSELIGSADGKKYRTFAQGLTFEIMIGYANEQLAKMSDRYLLIRDEELPLEVNVMDAYQGSEVRSVKNVSGGESFIISLALALGLSRMASRNVRVDSLFLDEGFGTLDEQSLETALQTLATLPQEGKIIGLISHVHGLKERIGTYISVTKSSGGKSTLSGPGISYQ